jgi:hypothetical protein
MSESLRIGIEIAFNLSYLAVIWTLVVLMTRRMATVAPQDRRLAGLVRLAFALLATGDTGHVGFRVLAYALGGLDARPLVLGVPLSLVGIGALTTAVTVTFFYMLMVYVWRTRFDQPANAFTSLLLAIGVLRLIIMALPGNAWDSVVAPQPMSLIRNLPLMVQGLGVMGLILSSAYRRHDVTFQWIGWMIAVSFGFYAPVILFAAQIPLLGMLMIPKTCAYLVIAFIAYGKLWGRVASPDAPLPTQSPTQTAPEVR